MATPVKDPYRKLSASSLRVGVVVPGDVRDANASSVVLLGAGTRVTQGHLQRLSERNIKMLLVSQADWNALQRSLKKAGRPPVKRPEERLGLLQQIITPTRWGKTPFDSIRVNQYRDTQHKHSQLLEEIHQKSLETPVRGELLNSVANESISAMTDDLDLFVKISLEPMSNTTLHEHCLKVGRLAISVASVLQYPMGQVAHVGMGCFLSRIGVAPNIRELILSPRILTPAELLEVRKAPLQTLSHIEHGSNIPSAALMVAFQLFERYDGSGYPRGRSGAQIHPLARIASVCDSYTALTSARPYRPAYDSYQAMELILQDTKLGRYDPTVVRGLLKTVSLYPLGSYVKLSDGRVGRVLRNNPEMYDRPIIELVSKSPLIELLDLQNEPLLHVIQCRSVTSSPVVETVVQQELPETVLQNV